MIYSIEKDELQVNKMPSAKYLWRLHMVSLNGNASIRAFGDPLVRARKAGRLMSFYHGLGMFFFGMGALIVGAIIAYYIINKVMKDDEEK